jgi:hypothetical protein
MKNEKEYEVVFSIAVDYRSERFFLQEE